MTMVRVLTPHPQTRRDWVSWQGTEQDQAKFWMLIRTGFIDAAGVLGDVSGGVEDGAFYASQCIRSPYLGQNDNAVPTLNLRSR